MILTMISCRTLPPPFEIPLKRRSQKQKDVVPNKFYILRNLNRSILAFVDPTRDMLMKIDKNTVYGIK